MGQLRTDLGIERRPKIGKPSLRKNLRYISAQRAQAGDQCGTGSGRHAFERRNGGFINDGARDRFAQQIDRISYRPVFDNYLSIEDGKEGPRRPRIGAAAGNAYNAQLGTRS